MANFCSGCGAKNRSNAKFCVSCGCNLIETTSTGSLVPGTVIDNRYEIKKLIKSGGMGAIYQAMDRRFNNKCAVKEMVLEDIKDDATYLTMRFQEEATLLRTLHHPNLPRVIDYFVEHGAYYLIMDFVDGVDLQELLERYGNPGLPEMNVIKWSSELLDVLSYLHHQNPPIIYRDMKPSNVMIRKKDQQVMLVDFGIARSILPDKVETLTTIGTPHYSSPEHFEGKYVPQSDLYSLAATMHHILTGKVPAPCMFKPVREINPEISPGLEAILEKALKPDITDRYDCADEMKSDLLDHLDSMEKVTADTDIKETQYVPVKSRKSLLTVKKTISYETKDETEEPSTVTGGKEVEARYKTGKASITEKREKIATPTDFFNRIQKTLPDVLQTILKREVQKAIAETTQDKHEAAQVRDKSFATQKKLQPQIDVINVKEGIPEKKDLPQAIINEKDKSQMILIPGGVYWIGNDDSNPEAVEIEKPKHQIKSRPYYIDKYQITNRQYCKFLNRKKMEGREEQWIYIDDRECKIEKIKGRYRTKTGYDDYPVVCVTWYGASAYAEWAEKRIPGEREWEIAARGPERREYPWGNEWNPKRCANRCYGGCGALMPVGSFPEGASHYGVEDMAGQVWEWCQDWLNAYPGSTVTSESFGTKFKIIRGGAWFLDNHKHFRSSFRRWYVPTFRYYFLGFRCCKNVD